MVTIRLLLGASILGTAVLATAPLSAWGQLSQEQGSTRDETRTWVRTPDTPERAAHRARMEKLAGSLQPMRADPESDVTLEKVMVTRDEGGRSLLRMTGRVKAAPASSMVWIADLESNTYRIFRITDPEKDSVRVADHLRMRGKPANVAGIRAAIEKARDANQKDVEATISRAKKEQVDPASAPKKKGAIIPLSQDPLRGAACYGFASGNIETWEVASLFWGPFPLTRTHTLNQWDRWPWGWDYELNMPTGWSWHTYRGGGCWAEPESFAYTTWYVDRCSWYWPATWDLYSDVLVTGEYHNNDFGDDNLPTYVSSGFGITFSNGFISWNSYHFADGEGVIAIPDLIWGHVNLGLMYTNCENW